jgi:acyl dehydratase
VKFNDFKEGEIIAAGRRVVTQHEITQFAKVYDPQWFHTDRGRAESSRWKGLIASGWMTCTIAMQLVVANVLHDSECIGSPGLEYLKWPSPLRPDDEVELRCEVLEKRLSRSGTFGIVRWRWVLSTQTGAQVLDLIVTNFFEL